jgi:trans-aconitate methyltransferase
MILLNRTRIFFVNSVHLPKIGRIYNDIAEISTDNKYDRITSIATFEHILNLPEVVAKSCLLLNDKGTLRISIPNEGSLFWKLGWKLTSSIEFNMKYKLSYETFLMHEHVNTAAEIEEVLKYFYSKIRYANFGFSRHVAFYRFFECSGPKTLIAQDYLKTLTNHPVR